jgi:DNA-binding beta-propeller fold protein YncE
MKVCIGDGIMNKAGRILSVNPPYALPGGEVIIECEGFNVDLDNGYGAFFDGQSARLTGASANRLIALVPENFDTHEVEIYLESGGERSESVNIIVGRKVAEDLHIVANPAVDPKDDSLILTRSGSRGQQLPVTLFRLEADDYLQEMSADIANPTGLAFDSTGQLFVTNRADGEVSRITGSEEVVPYASELGIATGIAFDKNGVMYVGDRSGTIYRVSGFDAPENFATLEPSVSAYHLAFDPAGNLCVAAPGLSSFDSVICFDRDGNEREFYRGLGRPQGLAFDRDGNLYVAACLRGRRGIVKISAGGQQAEIFVAGMNVVGLCFNRKGDLVAATNESVFILPLKIYGILLD